MSCLHPPQVSVPDLQPPPDESGPDLECAICFSEFNNVFRCPKMLNCKHTFCLECLARMNVKSLEPGAIQCPLCRGLTPLPPLGLPKLATDSDVLSYLPAAMQRVYSIRFVRNKGKLQVKRSASPGISLDHVFTFTSLCSAVSGGSVLVMVLAPVLLWLWLWFCSGTGSVMVLVPVLLWLRFCF
uniref:RING-type domain-containing protein n=1 Tax=Xiphophorus couchianus TaxID=32473 RepID=A0A3B5MKX6_9TELE